MEQSASQAVHAAVEQIVSQVGTQVFGQQDTVRLLAGAFLIGGHVLLEGPPGVAKTLIAKTFAGATGLSFKRIQFTPDLMPSDVTGVYVFDQNAAAFRFSAGPIFADVVLADEINRTPPKTQSALLEAMQEHFVTIDGKRHPLDEMFFVIATQNPIEHEGTFPLPEAQLDRFLFKLKVGYPERGFEGEMIRKYSSEMPQFEFGGGESERETPAEVSQVTERGALVRARKLLRGISLEPSVCDYVQRIVEATRTHPDLVLGGSPRAALHLSLAAKLRGALDGRDYTIPDDVKQMVPCTLGHRLVFQPEVYVTDGTAEKILAEILERTPVPEKALVS